MSTDDIRDLRSDIKDLTHAVAQLATEIALIKRDRAFAKWLIGVASSVATLVLNYFLTKGI